MFLLNFVNFICQWDKNCTTKEKCKTSNKTVLSALLALQSKSNLASLLIGDYLNSTGLGENHIVTVYYATLPTPHTLSDTHMICEA